VREEGETHGGKNRNARPPRNAASPSASATSPAARLSADRPYRTTTTRSSIMAADTTGPPQSPASPRESAATKLESNAASRHTDVQRSATTAATPKGTTTTTTVTNTAASPSSLMTPTSVRGRSGSATQYRVYQPSSLFGTNPTATPAAALSSLPSSQLMTDGTQRRLTSVVTSCQIASTLTGPAANDAEEDYDRTPSTMPQRSFDASAGADTMRESMASSLRRGSAGFSGSNTVTSHARTEKFGNTGSSGGGGCGGGAAETSTAVRRAGPALHAAALSTARVTADTDVPSPGASAAGRSNQTHSPSASAVTVASSPESAEAEKEEEGARAMGMWSSQSRLTKPSRKAVRGPSDDDEGRRSPSARPRASTSSQQQLRQHPRPAEGDAGDESPAVPACVQAVRSNPNATKMELWAALRAACQQCEALQHHVLRLENPLPADEEGDAKAEGSIKRGNQASTQHHPTSLYAVDPTRGGKLTRGGGTSAAATDDDEAPITTGRERSTAATHAVEVTPQHDGIPCSTFPEAVAGQPSSVDAGLKAHDRFTAAVAAAPAAAPASPLSPSALLRKKTRLGSNTATPSSAVSGGSVASSALRTRISEEIRRVEASRRGQQSAPQPPPETAGGRAEQLHTNKPEQTGSAAESSASNFIHPKNANSGSVMTNVTTKVPDGNILGRRKVREAVVKSREMEPWPLLGSTPPQLSHSSRMLRNPDHEEIEEDGEDGEEGGVDVQHGSDANDGVAGNSRVSAHRLTITRHASNVSDTVSVRSGNGLALPSIPSASVDNPRKSSFMSRSHNSGRLTQPQPPSSSTSESVAASVVTGSSTSVPQAYHRRLRGASFVSVESTSTGCEGSVASNGPGGVLGNDGVTAVGECVPPLHMQGLTASTTLPALRNDDAQTGPLSARATYPLHSNSNSNGVEGDGPGSAPRMGAGVNGSYGRDGVGIPQQHQQQQSSWLGRSKNPGSPGTSALPSVHSSCSPSQKSIVVPDTPLRSPEFVVGVGTTSMDPAHSRALKSNTATQPQGLSSRNADGRVLTPLPPSSPESVRSSLLCSAGHSTQPTSTTSPPSLMEMLRQVAEEDAPVPPPCDDKKSELREWRRQAAKFGMCGAPPAC
jgi:hypothetical protein